MIKKYSYKILSLVIIFLCTISLINIKPAHAKKASDWFESYDIKDTATMWKMLMRPITVLDAPEKTKIYLLDSPNGKKLKTDKLGGYINSAQAGVKILGNDENGYTLIEGYDDYDRLLQGYVKTNLLKEVSPNNEMGLIIDKLTQKIYVFQNEKYITSLDISTGLVNSDQPYNETSSGEYIITSWVGDFKSGNMLCRKAIRYNGGDLIHMVPCKVNADGTYDYSSFEPLLGARASHGCVRVQQKKNKDGYNMDWLWDNLKKNTKVLVWDDDGRERPYPDDYKHVYYNEVGGKFYHSTAMCSSVKNKYLPLTEIYYGQLRDEKFKSLTPCKYCQPPAREETIDKINKEALSDEDYENLMQSRKILHTHFNPDSVPAQIVKEDIKLEETPQPTEKPDDNNNATQYSETHKDNSEIELGIGD